jgi:hypothetical protein
VGQVGTEWSVNGTRLVEPDPTAFPNAVIQRNERTDTEVRTQFQLQF